jgi:hypothetical protein
LSAIDEEFAMQSGNIRQAEPVTIDQVVEVPS